MKNEDRIIKILVGMLAEQRETNRCLLNVESLLQGHSIILRQYSNILQEHFERLNHLTSRVGEALDTFFAVDKISFQIAPYSRSRRYNPPQKWVTMPLQEPS